MSKRILPYFTLLLLVFITTLAAWMPFILNGKMDTVYKNFDGPLYIIPAKTAYDVNGIKLLQRDASIPQNPLYFAAHLPLYPFLIRLGAYAVGYLKSMLSVTVLSTVLLAWFFYYLAKREGNVKHPLLLTSVLLLLPRFLVVRTVGSPEPIFMLLILSSLFFFEKKNYLLSGILGGLATMTKLPGILLFAAYSCAFLEGMVIRKEKWNWKYLYTLFVPVGLFAVFGLYALQYKDFFAYFHTNATVPMPYPFSVFNSQAKWVGTAWLEDVLFYFALYAGTVAVLWKSRHRSYFYFSFVFFIASLFIEHRDISRYMLPLWPLAVLAFEKTITSKKALAVFAVLIAGIYLYGWNFMGSNVMPITEWMPFL